MISDLKLTKAILYNVYKPVKDMQSQAGYESKLKLFIRGDSNCVLHVIKSTTSSNKIKGSVGKLCREGVYVCMYVLVFA